MTMLLLELFSRVLSVSAMASVLTVFILSAKWLLKHKLKPRWAYLLWTLLMLRLLLPWTPDSSISVFNILHMDVTPNEATAYVAEPASQIVPTEQPQPSRTEASHRIESGGIAQTVSSMQIGSWIWMIGAVSLLGYIFAVNLRFAWKVNKEPKLNDPRISSIFDRCKKEMNVDRSIELIKTNRVTSPTLTGVLNPKLLMPESTLRTLDKEQLRYVFLHELSHVKRKDIAANWIMNVLLALHWFNPLLWYAYRKMREDQEIACDALALTRINPEDSRNYALTIIKLLETFSRPVRLASAASISGNKSMFKRRITAISVYTKHSYRWSAFGLVVLLLLSGFALTDAKPVETPETVVDGYFKALGEKNTYESRIAAYHNERKKPRQTQKVAFYSVIREHKILEMQGIKNKKIGIVEVTFEHRDTKKSRAINMGSAVYEITLDRSVGRWVIESVISKDVSYKRNDGFQPILF